MIGVAAQTQADFMPGDQSKTRHGQRWRAAGHGDGRGTSGADRKNICGRHPFTRTSDDANFSNPIAQAEISGQQKKFSAGIRPRPASATKPGIHFSNFRRSSLNSLAVSATLMTFATVAAARFPDAVSEEVPISKPIRFCPHPIFLRGKTRLSSDNFPSPMRILPD